MHQLYDLGYQEIKDRQLLLMTALKLHAVILDIRLSPRSRDPKWNMKALEHDFSAGVYAHAPALGNKNYRDWSAPIAIKDMAAGMAVLRAHLVVHPVILMCACSIRETCHRLVVADYARDELGALQSIALDLSFCKRVLNGEHPWEQPPLF